MFQSYLYIRYLSSTQSLVNDIFGEYFKRLSWLKYSPGENANNRIYTVYRDENGPGKSLSLSNAGEQYGNASNDYPVAQRDSSFNTGNKLDLTDRDIFNRTWKAEKQSLYWIALRILENRQEAEDVVTEAFLQLYQEAIKTLEKEKLGREMNRGFINDLAVRGWLRVTVRNKALTLAEQRHYHRSKLNELSILFRDIETQWYQEDLLASVLTELYKQIEALPPKRREIFKLRYFGRLSNEAIAGKLGIEHQSVRNHLVKALKTLRLSMGQYSHLLSVLLVLIRRHD